MARKFKKDDKVIIIAGSSKGKIGKILSLNNDKVIIEGVNLATIHKKPTQSEAGSIIKKEKAIHISNISHISSDNKPVKMGFKISKDKDGKIDKIRYPKKAETKKDN